MSSTRYKVKYSDNLGPYLSRRDNLYLYVHEHHTSDVTTIYDSDGNIALMWSADSEEYADMIAAIIQNKVTDCKESWDGKLPAQQDS